MLKKRVFILFLSLFLFNLNANDILNKETKELLDYSYLNSSNEFFIKGNILFNNEITPVAIFKTKNRDSLYDYSIKINNDIYKISSKEFEDIYNKNDQKIVSVNIFETLPIEIFNYGLRNFDYSILERSINFKYKGLKTNKILLIEKEFIIPEPIIEEEVIPLPITSENNSEEITTDEEIITDQNNSNDENTDMIVPESEVINDINTNIQVIENKFVDGKYKKIILYQVDGTNIIIRKEFFLNKNDSKPSFIFDGTNIQYIKGYYSIIEYLITDVKNNKNYIFKFDNSSTLLSKTDISYEYINLTNFYGVK